MKKTTAFKPHHIKIKLLKICARKKENLEWNKQNFVQKGTKIKMAVDFCLETMQARIQQSGATSLKHQKKEAVNLKFLTEWKYLSKSWGVGLLKRLWGLWQIISQGNSNKTGLIVKDNYSKARKWTKVIQQNWEEIWEILLTFDRNSGHLWYFSMRLFPWSITPQSSVVLWGRRAGLLEALTLFGQSTENPIPRDVKNDSNQSGKHSGKANIPTSQRFSMPIGVTSQKCNRKIIWPRQKMATVFLHAVKKKQQT